MFATTTSSSTEEMGYNLIRMHIVSGKLKVGVRDYHLVETLPGWITLACLQHLQQGVGILPLINNCQKHRRSPVVIVMAWCGNIYHLSQCIYNNDRVDLAHNPRHC